jgi:hypothetical protein
LNVILTYVLSGLDKLPKAALATIARTCLVYLAPAVEAATTNQVLHDAEVFAFSQIDAGLAKIEAAGN